MPRINGFTLIELVIVISISALLSIVAIVQFRNFKADEGIKKAANELQSFIRIAQTNATTRLNCVGTTDSGPVTLSGTNWYILLETDQKTVKLKCSTLTPSMSVQKTLTLENNIRIDSVDGVSPCHSLFPGNQISIVFEPLYGSVSFIDPSASCIPNGNILSITLQDSVTSARRNVIINKGGVINVN